MSSYTYFSLIKFKITTYESAIAKQQKFHFSEICDSRTHVEYRKLEENDPAPFFPNFATPLILSPFRGRQTSEKMVKFHPFWSC